MMDFKTWRQGRNESFPAPRSEFPVSFAEFISIPKWRDTHLATQNLYFDADAKRITYASVRWDTGYRKGKFYAKDEVEPFYNEALALAEEMNGESPKSAQGYSHTDVSDSLFVSMHTSQVFLTSAINGIIYSLSAAAVVLLISTRSISVSFFSFLSIVCIVAGCMGAMVILGWELGIVEAVCASLVTGFSVDFVIHFANAFLECRESGRAQRSRFACFQMGVSVLGGANTTIGASIFLLMCDLTFFSQFGAFMCATIFFSLLYSNLFFISSMMLFGPEGK